MPTADAKPVQVAEESKYMITTAMTLVGVAGQHTSAYVSIRQHTSACIVTTGMTVVVVSQACPPHVTRRSKTACPHMLPHRSRILSLVSCCLLRELTRLQQLWGRGGGGGHALGGGGQAGEGDCFVPFVRDPLAHLKVRARASCMLAYADVCRRMLTYADVC